MLDAPRTRFVRREGNAIKGSGRGDHTVAFEKLVLPALLALEGEDAYWYDKVGGLPFVKMLIGLLACLKPALRGVRIQPTEALREG